MLTQLAALLQKHRTVITWGAILVAGYLLLFAFGITCPIKHLTGVSCAGCGMTRAWCHALTFRFAEAMEYNPAFWIVPPLGLFWLLQKKYRRIGTVGLLLCMAVLLIAYLLRLMDPTDSVVVFAPEEGAIWRAARYLLSLVGG